MMKRRRYAHARFGKEEKDYWMVLSMRIYRRIAHGTSELGIVV